ncbi:MAG TPA: hypothetical protein PK054_11250 [Anaerohalosphaeraceae bacterium]|nr:hypothetical protein [Anaerohalosphaeraceae bacterium]HOL89900.1 hypothetical protein [Anaerohalosphaeraceae bacterium]HPP57140.1 hypothetical protein [Anaerohalosphaeraceae bacterium]
MVPIDPLQFDTSQPVHPTSEQKLGSSDKTGKSHIRQTIRLDLGTDYQPYIQKALNESPEAKDSTAVLEARKALEQGELDGPQAALQAAEAILRFGI